MLRYFRRNIFHVDSITQIAEYPQITGFGFRFCLWFVPEYLFNIRQSKRFLNIAPCGYLVLALAKRINCFTDHLLFNGIEKNFSFFKTASRLATLNPGKVFFRK